MEGPMTFNGRLLAFVAALSSACGQILGAEGNAWRNVIKWTAHHDGTGSEGMGHGESPRDGDGYEISQITRIHPSIPATTMMGIGLMWDFQKRSVHAAAIT